uniref:Ribosomal protein S4 n=1 Tax=Thismia tentaculata TaxID=1841234 RepID=A0A1B0ZF26_9LILI|nr:ribosomal protein S4 [Thismia tentaculata]
MEFFFIFIFMSIYNKFCKKKVNKNKNKIIYPFKKINISKQIYNICLLEKYFNFLTLKKKLKYYTHIFSKKKKSKSFFLLQFLGMRLDNIIFKIGLCSVIYGARQLVNHGYIFINGHFINKSNFLCNFGDLITKKKI